MARARVIGVLAAGAWLSAAPAGAAVETHVLRYGPVDVSGYEVTFPKAEVATPRATGFVVRMDARLVDRHGRPVTIRDVMLHHVVFRRPWSPSVRHPCTSPRGEAFYGTGEENQSLRLPQGYGYRLRRGDRWRMSAMLMSHSLRHRRVFVEYRVVVDTRSLTPVRAFWVRADGCGPGSSYGLGGGGPPGSTDLRRHRWRIPFDGRIVAAGGHLHGGAKDMWLSQERCRDRPLLGTRPGYAMPGDLVYRARPILHEPGPVDTSYFLSSTGIHVRRGEVLGLTGAYDAERPHGVMAIMHVYMARDRATPFGCAPLPRDRRELVKARPMRSQAPAVHVPLNGLDARGRTYPITELAWPVRWFGRDASVTLDGRGFHPPRVSLPAGGRLTWRFEDREPHNVRYANGPRLMDAPTLARGASHTVRFGEPGRYELFCSLHSLTMHQVVEVRPRG